MYIFLQKLLRLKLTQAEGVILDVIHNSRPSDRVWGICEHSLWLDLLDNHIILIKKV